MSTSRWERGSDYSTRDGGVVYEIPNNYERLSLYLAIPGDVVPDGLWELIDRGETFEPGDLTDRIRNTKMTIHPDRDYDSRAEWLYVLDTEALGPLVRIRFNQEVLAKWVGHRSYRSVEAPRHAVQVPPLGCLYLGEIPGGTHRLQFSSYYLETGVASNWYVSTSPRGNPRLPIYSYEMTTRGVHGWVGLSTVELNLTEQTPLYLFTSSENFPLLIACDNLPRITHEGSYDEGSTWVEIGSPNNMVGMTHTRLRVTANATLQQCRPVPATTAHVEGSDDGINWTQLGGVRAELTGNVSGLPDEYLGTTEVPATPRRVNLPMPVVDTTPKHFVPIQGNRRALAL